jgi:Glycosyltransferases involved in cell wall biogenesis
MKNPFISILVPVYNAEKYLNECLDSIASQTYRNWEAMLVNDASKDDSLSICRQFADGDNRFRIIPQHENGGVMKARLRALEEASGDYIVWVDADDIIGSDRLSLMVEQIECHDVDVVITGYTRFVEKSGKKTTVFDSLAPGFFDKERWVEEKKSILAFDRKREIDDYHQIYGQNAGKEDYS